MASTISLKSVTAITDVVDFDQLSFKGVYFLPRGIQRTGSYEESISRLCGLVAKVLTTAVGWNVVAAASIAFNPLFWK